VQNLSGATGKSWRRQCPRLYGKDDVPDDIIYARYLLAK